MNGRDEVRRNHPRFQGDNFDRNLQIVEMVRRLVHQGEGIVPIPGTTRRTYLRDNVSAISVQLTPEELAELAWELPAAASRDRYPSQAMARLDR
jgi:aryl-alcohol dehydrogenase-like predicted oxidoreductase